MGLRSWIASRRQPKSLGERGEQAAARYLKRLGYHILARHLDLPLGELDLIVVEGRTVVFVEVKTRASNSAGHPADAIDDRKQQRMTQAALAYLKSHRLLDHASRFDVVAVTWTADAKQPTIEHIVDAFPAVGRGQFFS
jgi:putative endonuclease